MRSGRVVLRIVCGLSVAAMLLGLTQMVQGSLEAGAAGVSIGRNAFQHKTATKMVQALSRMVHAGASVGEALDMLKS